MNVEGRIFLVFLAELNKNKLKKIFFFTALIMGVISYNWRISMFSHSYIAMSDLCKILAYTAILLLVIQILFLNNFSFRKILIFLFFGAILIYAAKISKFHDLFNSYLFVWASTGIDLKKIFKVSFFCMLFTLFTTILSSLLGIIPNLAYYRNETFRYSMGETYTTIFSSIVFFTCVSFVCWNIDTRSKKLIASTCIFIIFIGFVTYFITDTRNDLICSLILALVVPWRYYSKVFSVNLTRVSILIFPTVVFAWTIISTYFFDMGKQVWVVLNTIFSNRLALDNYASVVHPVTLFGRFIVEYGNGYSPKPIPFYFYIDSSFARVYFLNGLVAFIFLYAVIQITFYLVIRKNNDVYTAILLVMIVAMIEGVFSQLFLSIGFNSTLFLLSCPLIGHLIYNKKLNH